MSDPTPSSTAPLTAGSRSFTKRKVGEVVSSLDALVRDPLSSALAKKRKISSPHSRTSTPALEAILARSSGHRPPVQTTAPPPNYDPVSLPALLDRLATYRLTSFAPSKPASLSPLRCALHGWVHTPSTRERIECITCTKGVVLLPPSDGDTWSSPRGQRLREEYERLVTAPAGRGHADNCPWRMRPCAPGLYKLARGGLGVPSGGRRRFLETVGQQARELTQRGLDALRLEIPPEALALVGTEEDRARLVKAVRSVAEETPRTDGTDETGDEPFVESVTTILLAIFGWTVAPATTSVSRSGSSSSLASLRSLPQSTSSGSPILSCTFCVRHVLTSPYLPSESSSAGAEPAHPVRAFDPIQQHQPFCVYVDAYAGHLPPAATTAAATAGTGPIAQDKGKGLLKPGWQVRLEAALQRPAGTVLDDARASTPTRARGETANPDRVPERTTAAKTKELLSYVRQLLGPKGAIRASTNIGPDRTRGPPPVHEEH